MLFKGFTVSSCSKHVADGAAQRQRWPWPPCPLRCTASAQSSPWGNMAGRRGCRSECRSIPSRRTRMGSTLSTCTQPAARSKSSRYSWALWRPSEAALLISQLWHSVTKSESQLVFVQKLSTLKGFLGMPLKPIEVTSSSKSSQNYENLTVLDTFVLDLICVFI